MGELLHGLSLRQDRSCYVASLFACPHTRLKPGVAGRAHRRKVAEVKCQVGTLCQSLNVVDLRRRDRDPVAVMKPERIGAQRMHGQSHKPYPLPRCRASDLRGHGERVVVWPDVAVVSAFSGCLYGIKCGLMPWAASAIGKQHGAAGMQARAFHCFTACSGRWCLPPSLSFRVSA